MASDLTPSIRLDAETLLSRFWHIGNYQNSVVQGDCTELMGKFPDGCVDFALTDPPYITNYRDRQGRSVFNDDNAEWILPAFQEVHRLLKADAFCVSFYGWNKVHLFLEAWLECGFRPVGQFIWVKDYASSIGYSQMFHESAYLLVKGRPAKPAKPLPDVLSWSNTGNKLHPTQKPVVSLAPLVETFSPPGGIVLDPFCGSGSTGIAALRCGRKFLMFEKEPTHFKTAQARLASFLNRR